MTLGCEKTAEYMKKLSEDGCYSLTKDELALIQKSFVGYYTSEEETKETIKFVYENKNCLIDTHTAVAVHAAKCYANDSKAERKILAVSTASPYKFARDVYTSVSGKEPASDLSALSELSDLTGVQIPAPLSNLADKAIIHDKVIDKSEMVDATLDFARA